MRALSLGLVALFLAAPTAAQSRLEVGAFAGPFVKVQNGNDETLYDASVAAGVQAIVPLGNGASAFVGYTVTDGTAIREGGEAAPSDTLGIDMVEFGVTARADRLGFRLEPVLGFGVYSFEPSRGFFTTGLNVAFSPAPRSRFKPWVGVEGRYYGLRPFVDDGLYLVSVKGSVDL